MKDLPIRTATALALGTITIGAVYYSAYTLNLLLILIAAIASFEYIKLAVYGAEISSPLKNPIKKTRRVLFPSFIKTG